ncbi:hypothetical protein SPSIL_008740 [Sporomusa silvacetica DSM 10669]|uniref:Uncharacterized protein n=1 Tax=Sporomusa silvacetica DSM 10669 TaxID=1123289 RepID=A0ABZ3IGG4_9FIRM|nr:hypothetical protein [Sporomusa silvacetica]OZC13166.1 hypothetical protein SPSIL_56220 [Sporomusa silvacetica DSM 10669]
MISNPYPTKGTAKSAAKVYAQENGIKKFLLMLDLDKRQYHFTDQEKDRESKMIVFARYALIKDKWRDKSPLGKVASRGGIIKNESFLGGK